MNVFKYIITAVVMMTTAGFINGATSYSQSVPDSMNIYRNKAKELFNRYKEDAFNEFETYRKKVNAEYAEALKGKWDPMPVKVSKQTRTSPPKPLIRENQTDSIHNEVPEEETLPEDTVANDKSKIGVQPIEDNIDNASIFVGNFYGTPIVLSQPFDRSYSLPENSPAGVSALWRKMNDDDDMFLLIEECKQLKSLLNLNDWGYYKLAEFIADKVSGEKDSDISRVINMFILANSSYRVRIGKAHNRLQILMPIDNAIPNWSYAEFDGAKHYVVTDKNLKEDFPIFRQGFPGERVATLYAAGLPKLQEQKCKTVLLDTPSFPEISIDINKNLIDYLNDFPVTNDFGIYVSSGISKSVKSQLYPVLQTLISGNDEKAALDIILRFVQRGFKYKNDREQFGYERPLFADESLYYSYNDCEDRAIIFNILVNDFLHLKTVLISYPNHVASAVKLQNIENIIGDRLTLADGAYIICDPTYIGSVSGQSMPEFKDTVPEIIRY